VYFKTQFVALNVHLREMTIILVIILSAVIFGNNSFLLSDLTHVIIKNLHGMKGIM